ncbi:MAG: pyridoxal phosphate-dependent aminotransferase [Lachnospiraceae bacterium]|nr:pyridoxal phosphate-dependent aminotransferase [Lachnospiraceae bacterium]
MKYDFDKVTDRTNTNSLKYDFAKERGKPDGVLPMWVADMDFPAPPPVLEDIKKAVAHGIFGYTEVKRDYYLAVSEWFRKWFDYDVSEEEIVKTPGIVFALAQMVRAYTNPGDSVMIQTPVYYPFYEIIRDNNRTIVKNPLVYKNGKYFMDFEDFERKAVQNNVKLFILCSPHNPVGRVWNKDELQAINEICERYGILIISDEIHCDFIYEGHPHTVFGHINENAIICTAPSKTFNLAGLQASNIFIKNAELRRKLAYEIQKSGYSQLNTLGLIACMSAYLNGGEWLSQLKEYLWGNISLVREFLTAQLPEIKLIEPEGTYLLWLNFSSLGLTQKELDNLITNKAKLWLSSGTAFGEEGNGFWRMNIACPRAILEDALLRLEGVLKHPIQCVHLPDTVVICPSSDIV